MAVVLPMQATAMSSTAIPAVSFRQALQSHMKLSYKVGQQSKYWYYKGAKQALWCWHFSAHMIDALKLGCCTYIYKCRMPAASQHEHEHEHEMETDLH